MLKIAQGMVLLPLANVTHRRQAEVISTSGCTEPSSALGVHSQLPSIGTEMNMKEETEESRTWPPKLSQGKKNF